MTDVKVHIRPANPADVDAIVAFARAVVPAHYAPILGEEAAHGQLAWWTSERIAGSVAAGRIQVAVADDTIVGVVETGELAGEQVIWKLYLAPDSRGSGWGRELLHRAIAALPPDTDHVLVEHFAGNIRAGRFYEREGFVEVDSGSGESGGSDGARDVDATDAVVWRRLDLRPAATQQ